MQLGLTDASIVVQAARHKTTRILSLDHKHFGAVRPLTGEASFTLLPGMISPNASVRGPVERSPEDLLPSGSNHVA